MIAFFQCIVGAIVGLYVGKSDQIVRQCCVTSHIKTQTTPIWEYTITNVRRTLDKERSVQCKWRTRFIEEKYIMKEAVFVGFMTFCSLWAVGKLSNSIKSCIKQSHFISSVSQFFYLLIGVFSYLWARFYFTESNIRRLKPSLVLAWQLKRA